MLTPRLRFFCNMVITLFEALGVTPSEGIAVCEWIARNARELTDLAGATDKTTH